MCGENATVSRCKQYKSYRKVFSRSCKKLIFRKKMFTSSFPVKKVFGSRSVVKELYSQYILLKNTTLLHKNYYFTIYTITVFLSKQEILISVCQK